MLNDLEKHNLRNTATPGDGFTSWTRPSVLWTSAGFLLSWNTLLTESDFTPPKALQGSGRYLRTALVLMGPKVISASQEHLAMSGGVHFYHWGREHATGIYWVEAKDTANHLMTHRTATDRSCVYSAVYCVQKLCTGENGNGGKENQVIITNKEMFQAIKGN